MPDVKHHLSELDRLEAPELWDKIERRIPRADLPPSPSPMHKAGIVVLALLLAAGSFALVVRSFRGGEKNVTVGPIPSTPENGLMVVTRSDKWGSHLYLVDPRSPEASPSDPITRTPGDPEFDSEPAISPDGITIAFVRKSYGETITQTIWLINIDGTSLRRLTDPTIVASDPAWSPDGSQLAYVTEQPGAHRIFTVGVPSGGSAPSNATVVSPAGLDATGPTWSPEGDQIAYSVSSDGTPASADLYVTDLDSGTVRELTDTPVVGEVQPDWSPDGTQIAFTSTTSTDLSSPYGAIAVMDVASGHLRILTVGDTSPRSVAGRFDQRPIWSPDGRLIAFDEVMYPSGGSAFEDSQIFTIDPDGTQMRAIDFGHDLAWQPVADATTRPTAVGAFQDIDVLPAAWHLVVAYGSVWVTGGGGVMRVDTATGEVLVQIDVAHVDESDITAGGDHVWVTTRDSIVGIDATTNEVDRRFVVQTGISEIVFANDRLYVGHSREGDGDLSEIDPITGAFGRGILTGGPALGESDILATGNAFWVSYSSPASSGLASGLVRVSSDLSEAQPVPGVDRVFSLAEADGFVWAVGTEALYKIDAAGTLVGTFPIPLAGKVTSDGQHLWLLTNTGSTSDSVYLPDPNVPARVVQIDTATGALVDDGLALPHDVPANIAFGDGRIWVSFYDSGTLTGVYG